MQQNREKQSCSYHFETYFSEILIEKKLEKRYCSTICDVINMSYTKIKTRGPNGSTRGMKMGSDGPLFGGPMHYFCDRVG